MSFGGHIREKDPDLTILDAASGATILQANTSRLLALLGKTGFINGQDSGLLAQLLKRVGAQVIAYAIGVPDSLREQALHPIGASFSRVFSQLPAVFAGRFTQDALQIRQCPPTWLRSGKTGGNAGMQMEKLLDPTANIGGGRPGFGACGTLVLLHVLLLLDVNLWVLVLHLQSVTSERRRTWSFSSAFQALMAGLTSATVVCPDHDGFPALSQVLARWFLPYFDASCPGPTLPPLAEKRTAGSCGLS